TDTKDYREDLMITTRTIEKQTIPVVNNIDNNKSAMKEINQAFQNSNYQSGEIYSACEITNLTKDSNLRSKYYLNNISIKDNLFVINGVGNVCLQKPFLLEKPLRMVFDMPNTILKNSLFNKELTLSNGDKIKAGQFTTDTARLVITSENAAKYIPVYSADSRSFMLTSPQNLMTSHLPTHKTNIVKTAYQKSDKSDNLIFEFDKPLCYSIKRTSEYLFIYFLNAEKYNDANFQSVIRTTPYSEIYVNLMKNTGIRLTMPVKTRDNIQTCLSPDGKVFKLSSQKSRAAELQAQKEELQKVKKREGVITTLPKAVDEKVKGVILIDAGHGGKDCGALKDGVNEKDINLDVSTRLLDILKQKGYKVYMTRTNDTYLSLEERTTLTEEINPDVFVSIHVNSCNVSSPKGIETHYYHENSLELANSVHTKLTKKVSNTPNRGLLKSRFYVINHTTVPAILVEIGFISNPEERHQLTTPQRKQATAEGIAEGIIEYLNKQKQ
ncbi:MAG: N-acetylmuramoyl-L-alanine amidase, partial [Candidatus Gastranaerophilales bacterium]|nr:N-acetylmuramoyl-L-alanine amidase [Candidatus Gastranaerophilales bacterium]